MILVALAAATLEWGCAPVKRSGSVTNGIDGRFHRIAAGSEEREALRQLADADISALVYLAGAPSSTEAEQLDGKPASASEGVLSNTAFLALREAIESDPYALGEYLELLTDEDAETRHRALRVCNSLARDVRFAPRDFKRVIAALANALRIEHSETRGLAAMGLASAMMKLASRYPYSPSVFGEVEADILNALQEGMTDQDGNVRVTCMLALGRAVLVTNEYASNWPDAFTWFSSRTAETLRDALKDEDARVRWLAAVHAGEMGERGIQAVPALGEALSDEDADVRVGAARALLLITGEHRGSLPVLIQALRESGSSVAATPTAQRAAEALATIGPEAHEAMPSLLMALKDEDERVRSAASEAIWIIGEPAEEIVPALTALLDDDDSETRSQAAYVLGRMGADAREALPVLREMLGDPAQSVRGAVRTAVNRIEADIQRKAENGCDGEGTSGTQ